jgi:hypothetical protein
LIEPMARCGHGWALRRLQLAAAAFALSFGDQATRDQALSEPTTVQIDFVNDNNLELLSDSARFNSNLTINSRSEGLISALL